MISGFVALSVALGIASVLSVSVVQRTREIGILRAMVRSIFWVKPLATCRTAAEPSCAPTPSDLFSSFTI